MFLTYIALIVHRNHTTISFNSSSRCFGAMPTKVGPPAEPFYRLRQNGLKQADCTANDSVSSTDRAQL